MSPSVFFYMILIANTAINKVFCLCVLSGVLPDCLISSVCILQCFTRWFFCVKHLSHWPHWYGFSPVSVTFNELIWLLLSVCPLVFYQSVYLCKTFYLLLLHWYVYWQMYEWVSHLLPRYCFSSVLSCVIVYQTAFLCKTFYLNWMHW